MSKSLIFLPIKTYKTTHFNQILLIESLVFVSKRASEQFVQEKKEWFAHSLIYHERPEQIAHSHSFVMSDRNDSLSVAHLSWAIWGNHSQLLIWFEWSEQMSNEQMSNEQMSNEQMSNEQWANERIPNPEKR